MLEFDALLKRKEIAEQKARLNAGYIWAATLNAAPFGDPNRRPAQPTDIVPGMRSSDADEADLTQMTAEEQKRYLMNVFYGTGKG